MTNAQLIAALQELPSTSHAVVRLRGCDDFEIEGIVGEDIVPPDVDQRPDARVINGITAILA